MPAVISARLTRPLIGAVTRVKLRFSRARSSCAWIASTPALASCAVVVRVSASSAEIALLPSKRCPRCASLAVRSSVARACCNWAWKRSTSCSKGRGSIWNNRSPFFTNAPSVKATRSICPDTRGRTSTVSGASSRAVTSSHSVIGCSITLATVTCGSPGALAATGARSQAASIVSANAASG
ncbi:hypothetical protein D3C73_1124630 [compost metagenome]